MCIYNKKAHICVYICVEVVLINILTSHLAPKQNSWLRPCTHKYKQIDTVRNAWDLTEKVLALYIFWCAGNETFERMASFGLLANFMVYLTRELHMDQASAANILNLWSGVSNFAPLLGAFISDSYVGRFSTIAFGSFALFLVCPPSFLNYLL